jgi:NAD-dependent SIR2 family protein deacetylase
MGRKRTYKCTTCKNTDFDDVSLEDMACTNCGKKVNKDAPANDEVVHVTDMDRDDFEVQYCSKCSLTKLCKTTNCYNEYHVGADTLFATPGRLPGNFVSLNTFKNKLKSMPSLLVIYASVVLEDMTYSKAESYHSLDELVEPLYKMFKEDMGFNFEFLKKFFFDGWFIKKGTVKKLKPIGFTGSSSYAYRPSKPVLFTFDEGNTQTQEA